MKAYTYIEKGRFELVDKPRPELQDPKDALVRVTLIDRGEKAGYETAYHSSLSSVTNR